MDIELIGRLEGLRLLAYDDSLGFRTVGYGFNMEASGAKEEWEKLGIQLDFDAVFNKRAMITDTAARVLFRQIWAHCIDKAKKRASELDVDYDKLPEWHQFILTDIAYNTGSVSKWSKVFTNTKPDDVLLEARRNPKKLMDNRVAKIGHYFGLVKSVEEAKAKGLVYTKYII